VRPNPELALRLLCDPKLQPILPAACLPPTALQESGRLAASSQWLLRNSTLILYGGLGLFIGLGGYRLVRDPLGLVWQNVPAFIALLTLLAALGFVWSKAPIKRETIEQALQYRLADYFKSMNNLKRAAFHEHKAEALRKANKDSHAVH
jgi:hypothetical protein